MQTKNEYLAELKFTLDNYTEQLANIKQHFQNASAKDIDAITKSLKSLLEKAQDAYKKLASASEEDWEEVKKITAKVFEEVKSSFTEAFNSSSKKVKQLTHQISRDMENQLHTVESYIKENPFKSILLSLGLGLLIGKLCK